MVARGPGVRVHDLRAGIPLAANTADAIYHAAVLEHIRRGDVPNFLRENYLVLKPGGIIRVGVPDLEQICRLYLEKLEAALVGQSGAAEDYDWIILEMLDQMVREKSGGKMVDFLRCERLPNKEFVYERIGNEGRNIVESSRATKPPSRIWTYRWSRAIARKLRDRLLILLAGADAVRALAIGRFRLSGEVHQWMYDRFSLARELLAAGFRQPIICSASQSAIPDWKRFCLDIQPDGILNKPDLMFMEAIKPGSENV
jgi:SAM-dependent methyltransferase